MNIKAWIPLVVAVVLGLIAAIMARNLTAPSAVETGKIAGTVEVVTANRNIAPGEEIRPEDLALRTIAAADAPEGTFLDVTELTGRVAMVQMVKGQPVLESLLAPSGVAAGLQALVPEGMRAITIEVNEFSGLAGMIVPQARVDVLATVQGNGEPTVSRTIVQNVEVKAVGQRVSIHQEKSDGEPQEFARSVTLLVTPEQAEAIELAAVTARPRLVLRGSNDRTVAQTNGVTLTELRTGKAVGARRDPFGTRMVEDAGRDPFDAQPVIQSLSPTTRPTNEPLVIETREIQVIRGGVESHVTVEYRRPESIITGVSIDGIDSK